jgi:hypothetical protein
MKEHNICHINSTPSHPQENGKDEVTNQNNEHEQEILIKEAHRRSMGIQHFMEKYHRD